MGQVRTWREVLALRPTQVERRLIRKCKSGQPCKLGDDRPDAATPARTIRAELLRYLILGGCERCRVAEAGVQLVGAWVSGRLNLNWATAQGPVGFLNCRFANAVSALQVHLPALALNGSALPGLSAPGARVTGTVVLRGIFDKDGKLVRAFHASSGVKLSEARIDGQLSCDGGRFGKPEGVAFNAQQLRVKGSFIWRRVTVENGTVHLAAAHVGDLVDDPESWPDGGRVILDGFTYNRIAASFTDARRRLKWLAKGDRWNGEFFPQPYAQLARVLRAMGHDRAARDVLVAQGRRLRRQIRHEAAQVPAWAAAKPGKALRHMVFQDGLNAFRWLWDLLQRLTVGYGHRPVQSIYALLLLFTLATVLADRAWQAGDFAPNSDVILTSPCWQALADSAANPAQDWSAADGPGRDWESFSRYAFAADVVIPLIDFGQTQAWAPSTTRGPWGRHLWWARWVLSVAGWIVTALAAAAVTGIIQRERA